MIRGWVAETSLLIFALAMIITVRFASGGFMEVVQLAAPWKLISRFRKAKVRSVTAGNTPG
jgi:hypothetical protein